MSQYNIYPKQFRNSNIPIEKNRCFMLMPFDERYDYIYGEIKKYLNKSEYICNRADEIFGSVPIMSNVLTEILKAHFIIADLTDQNANVFYELGIAHSFKDAHNIVLIAQSVEDVPFDIRHLSTIIYSESNIKHLTSNILKTIKDNGYYYSFYEALQKNSIISLIHDDKDAFFDKVQASMRDKVEVLTDVLNRRSSIHSKSDVKQVLDKCLGLLYETSASNSTKNLKSITKVLAIAIADNEHLEYSKEIINHLLFENKLENYPVSNSEIVSLQSDLAIHLASETVFFDVAMSWIVEYFSKSKSATVDLNRYSVERFLLSSKNQEVDKIIANSVFHSNNYVREHMADICGEKNITHSVEPLIIQLRREENIYVSSSIITALGKLKNRKAYESVVEWFEEKRERIISTQHYFILKHIWNPSAPGNT